MFAANRLSVASLDTGMVAVDGEGCLPARWPRMRQLLWPVQTFCLLLYIVELFGQNHGVISVGFASVGL